MSTFLQIITENFRIFCMWIITHISHFITAGFDNCFFFGIRSKSFNDLMSFWRHFFWWVPPRIWSSDLATSVTTLIFIATQLVVSTWLLRDTVGERAGMLMVNVGHCLKVTVGIDDLYTHTFSHWILRAAFQFQSQTASLQLRSTHTSA